MIKENSESRKLVREVGDLIFDNLKDAEFEYEFKKFLSWYTSIPEVDEIVPASVPFGVCYYLDSTGQYSTDDGFYTSDDNMIGLNLEAYFLSHLGYTVDEMNKKLVKIVKKSLPVDFQKKVLEKMYSVFIHEVSHFLDTKLKNIPVFNKSQITSDSNYYNHPNEVNSTLTAAILRVQRNPDWKKLPFDKFMKKVIGEIHPTLIGHFSKENKNRMMKSIYTAYHGGT